MLVHRLRRHPNFKPTLSQCLCWAFLFVNVGAGMCGMKVSSQQHVWSVVALQWRDHVLYVEENVAQPGEEKWIW